MKTISVNDQQEAIKKTDLYKELRFHVVQLSMKANAVLKPHASPTGAFLQMLEGEIIFTIHKKENHLRKGDTFTFKANEIHSVNATTNAVFLLVK